MLKLPLGDLSSSSPRRGCDFITIIVIAVQIVGRSRLESAAQQQVIPNSPVSRLTIERQKKKRATIVTQTRPSSFALKNPAEER